MLPPPAPRPPPSGPLRHAHDSFCSCALLCVCGLKSRSRGHPSYTKKHVPCIFHDIVQREGNGNTFVQQRHTGHIPDSQRFLAAVTKLISRERLWSQTKDAPAHWAQRGGEDSTLTKKNSLKSIFTQQRRMSAPLWKGTNCTVDVTKKLYFLTLAQTALSHAVQLKHQRPAHGDSEAAHTVS